MEADVSEKVGTGTPGQTESERMALVFKALGHPTRLRIVEHLIRINACVCREIVDIFPFSQSTVSQHLKILKDSGIVCGEVEGPKTWFCVDRQVLEEFKGWVALLGENGDGER